MSEAKVNFEAKRAKIRTQLEGSKSTTRRKLNVEISPRNAASVPDKKRKSDPTKNQDSAPSKRISVAPVKRGKSASAKKKASSVVVEKRSEETGYGAPKIPVVGTSSSTARTEDPNCIFCSELFSMSRAKEKWAQCTSCNEWAHNECAGLAKNFTAFVCDFCN